MNDSAAVSRIFDLAENGHFDIVYNCTTLLKTEQSDEAYKRFILGRSLCVAEVAQKRNVGVFVHLGSGLECVDPNGVHLFSV